MQAVRVLGWPHWPLASALSLSSVPLSRCSTLVQYLLRAWLKKVARKKQMRDDAMRDRAAVTRLARAGRVVLAFLSELCVDSVHLCCADFRVCSVPYHHWAGDC